MPNLKMGDKLKNGAIVVVIRERLTSHVILANLRGEWVTWEFDIVLGDCYFGHYFGKELSDFNDAVADFQTR